MLTQKINIRFILNRIRIREAKGAPLYCRITYKSRRNQFSTDQFLNPKNWNSKQQLVKPPEPDRNNINTQLSLIKIKINKAFLLLQVKEEEITIEDIYSLYIGKKTQKQYNVIEYFDVYLNRLKTLIGIDIKQVTWNKFDYVKTDAKNFIKYNSYLKEIAEIIGIEKNLTTHMARRTFASTVLL
ncbi:hypothetical protein [Mariniflexile sp. AS56]|uniref:hypothetical protein n=1 Tax=Mariniflexile sp. AS56 TaxID=3063957 RepID=UPI0034E967EF